MEVEEGNEDNFLDDSDDTGEEEEETPIKEDIDEDEDEDEDEDDDDEEVEEKTPNSLVVTLLVSSLHCARIIHSNCHQIIIHIHYILTHYKLIIHQTVLNVFAFLTLAKMCKEYLNKNYSF